MRNVIPALTVAATLLAAPAMAQDHHRAQQDSARGGMEMMHGQQGMMGGMMGMAAGPDMILRLQESLELTEDQVRQLEALQESAREEMRQHMMQGMQTMRSASELLASDAPELDAYEAQLREGTNHMVLAHTAMAQATVEARELLTAEQRERLALARSVMKEMRQGEMPKGMMGGMHGSGGSG